MTILGLHHITLVCANAQRTTDFYTQVLGLRLIKQTVNFDAPDTYHLYFGDQTGSPGTAITFFEWPQAAPGAAGIGGTHHVALQVAGEPGLQMWKRRLTDLGLKVAGPYDRRYFRSIYFRDPDGVLLEIATQGPGLLVDETAENLGGKFQAPPASSGEQPLVEPDGWPEPVPAIRPEMSLQAGMHHISAISADIERTDAFYRELLGLQRVKQTANFDNPSSAHWYWGLENGRPGTLVTYFEHDPAKARRAQLGQGQTHHFALAVADEESQLAWREQLLQAGLRVTPVLDRVYFKSIYLRDPDGHIVELATLGPGFQVDESQAALGQRLQLPPWLEAQRAELTAGLQPLTIPTF